MHFPCFDIERILLLECFKNDQELIKNEIESAGINAELIVCSNEISFKESIYIKKPDIILSDYFTPGFHGFEALAYCKKFYPEIPFIFISSSISEELANETVIANANAYIFKENIRYLPLIIQLIWSNCLIKGKIKTQGEKIAELNERVYSLQTKYHYY